ncbi:MAG: 50S ribosomal protein L11 methyltransferase [Ruminococcaceae bacterium]|nr:50S ribosomal protein L11 methyltransferase [Oscillospiraceae bacterium]
MEWTQLKVTVNIEKLDETAAVMGMLDNGLMIEDYSDIETNLKTVYGDLIDESILNADKSLASVSIYVPEEKNYNDYIAFLKERFEALSIDAKIELIGLDEEEWSTAWKKYYKPINVSDRLVIVPMWEDYEAKNGEVIVKMDPGMAFGTGTHETTRLVAGLIEKYMKVGDCVLDVGTGSGILSICAAKLGASRCAAYDIDPVAVRVACENCEKNGCSDIIKCGVSDLLKDVEVPVGGFDFAVANIVADIIIRLSPDIGACLKDGAFYITSGIIEEREQDVLDAMKNEGFAPVETVRENGWCAIVFQKKNK